MLYQHQNHECHNKLLADFNFIGSCSLVATGTLNAQFSFMSINFTHKHTHDLSCSQLAIARKARMSPCGTHFYHRKNRWLHVSFSIVYSCLMKTVIKPDWWYHFLHCAAFACHDQGASCLTYAPQHQLIISAGKKGDVCIFDMRQRTLRHRFQVR